MNIADIASLRDAYGKAKYIVKLEKEIAAEKYLMLRYFNSIT